jgi:hypothetical protein
MTEGPEVRWNKTELNLSFAHSGVAQQGAVMGSTVPQSAEPLLEPVFSNGQFRDLDEFVGWDVPADVRLAPREILAAMNVRAFPERDRSHKRLKDLADLHALVWYGSDFNLLRPEVVAHLTQEDSTQFTEAVTDEVFTNAALLIGVDTDVLGNSVRRLLI